MQRLLTPPIFLALALLLIGPGGACGDHGSGSPADPPDGSDTSAAPDAGEPDTTTEPPDVAERAPDAADIAHAVDLEVTLDVAADVGPQDADPPPPGEDMARDLQHVRLSIDVSSLTGSAWLRVAPSTSAAVSFAAEGLTIAAVSLDDQPLLFEHTAAGRLDVGVPVTAEPVEIRVDYAFSTVPTGSFRGYMESGSTLLWPYWCGNLFPCHPHPADGLTFELEVLGVPEGEIAVHPAAVTSEVPAYAIAFAVGEYSWVSLGQTTAGTEVGYWTLPSTVDNSAKGAERLLEVVEWYEQTLGPYSFGSPVGPVPVDWGLQVGGIEHHPLWHTSTYGAANANIQAHEAAHGWFGTGVRLACWEDLVLSEGTADYLTARVAAALGTEADGEKIFTGYRSNLSSLVSAGKDAVAWPDSCNEIDVLTELFSSIPYYKGALFLRDVAQEVGAQTLDGVLAAFYQAHANQPATMQGLLDLLEAQTGFDPGPLSEAWLRGLGIPEPRGGGH